MSLPTDTHRFKTCRICNSTVVEANKTWSAVIAWMEKHGVNVDNDAYDELKEIIND